MMQGRGLFVDHATVHRWAIKVLPVLLAIFQRRMRPVNDSGRLGETHIKVADQLKYLYRAVDKFGGTLDFLLTAKRDKATARWFLDFAIYLHDVPEKITIDKSRANTVANESVNQDGCLNIAMREPKYLNGMVEQDHRGVKRIANSILRLNSFWRARIIIVGIEVMHQICTGQLRSPNGKVVSTAAQFYGLAD